MKPDKSWCLLRAAVPVGGRTLPVLDMVFAGTEAGSPAAEQRFLQRLQQVVPETAKPTLVTDAGFRRPWFRSVDAIGWHWLGRLRHRTMVKPVDAHGEDQWVPSRALYALLNHGTQDMGLMDIVQTHPWTCRVVLHRKPAKGRKHLNLKGAPRRGKQSRKSAAGQREPWLLVASPGLELSAPQIVSLYTRRMQIELSFRDLKSHRHGNAFEDSLTRSSKRIGILLLVHALANFASWLAGMACRAIGLDAWLAPSVRQRRCYSIMRASAAKRWCEHGPWSEHASGCDGSKHSRQMYYGRRRLWHEIRGETSDSVPIRAGFTRFCVIDTLDGQRHRARVRNLWPLCTRLLLLDAASRMREADRASPPITLRPASLVVMGIPKGRESTRPREFFGEFGNVTFSGFRHFAFARPGLGLSAPSGDAMQCLLSAHRDGSSDAAGAAYSSASAL